jgi:hypothetical protein
MPDELAYDSDREELIVGHGRISNVSQAMRDYGVSGANVLDRWFSARRKTRRKPVIGDRNISELLIHRAPTWLPEYTTELIDLLNVIRELIELQGDQADLLGEIVEGELVESSALLAGLGRWARPVRTRRETEDAEGLW